MFLPANIMNIIHINITSTLHFFKKRKTFLKKHGYKHLQLKTKRHEPPNRKSIYQGFVPFKSEYNTANRRL